MPSEPTESVPDLPPIGPLAPPAGRRRPYRRLGTVVAGAVGLFVATVAGSNLLIRARSRPHIHATVAEVGAPFAIVPGASVHRDGTPSPQLEDRLAAALSLLRAGRVRRILVSGARDGAYDEAGPMRRWLIQRGVRPGDIVEDHAGFRTLDTMARAARVYAVREAVVCTQSFHLPRAVFLARRAGIDASGLIAGATAVHHPTAADQVRESLASFVAVLDSYVFHRQPRHPVEPPSPAATGDTPSARDPRIPG